MATVWSVLSSSSTLIFVFLVSFLIFFSDIGFVYIPWTNKYSLLWWQTAPYWIWYSQRARNGFTISSYNFDLKYFRNNHLFNLSYMHEITCCLFSIVDRITAIVSKVDRKHSRGWVLILYSLAWSTFNEIYQNQCELFPLYKHQYKKEINNLFEFLKNNIIPVDTRSLIPSTVN